MNAYELADAIEDWETGANYTISIKAGQMLRQQAKRIEELEKELQSIAMDELVKWQQEFDKPVAWMIIDVDNGKSLQFKENKFSEINIPLYTAPKELSDEELNKAFDYYCETDEGVLRFNYELRDEWKKEQLIRWKEAFKKASEK